MTTGRRDLVAALRERGLVHQVTDEGLGALSAGEEIRAYNGFDPTAPSLHAGSLYPVMVMAHLARAGHRPVALVGGGTGLIGDPGGRDSERPLMDADLARENARAMGRQIGGLLRNAGIEAEVLDNRDWLEGIRLVDFLRDIGKHFTVNWMMAKDSVRTRLEDREGGISFTEFSYMLLQAYDFWRLWKDRGCRLQTGASDQWGNITAGIELIRRRSGGEAFGLTCPLLLAPDGRKFGKSAGNAVWLDPALTSPYRFYQFWMNQEDGQAAALLGPYTLLPLEEVAALRAEAAAAPERRIAQRRLAAEATAFVHGRDAAARAERASRVLFGEGSIRDLDAATLEEVFAEVPGIERPFSAVVGPPTALRDLFTDPALGLLQSSGEFRRALEQGALYLNGERAAGGAIPAEALVEGRLLVLRRGKKDYALVRVTAG
ncbi:MAG: tyrosine--tRNA ligase [Planctomycetes bacterium]|nr:tyrosine--tRNA ligase [Planctomycetota bacterium]